MKKLLLLILIILPCVVFAQNKSKKKVIKTKNGTITEWSEDGGLFRHYSKDYVTVIGGDDGGPEEPTWTYRRDSPSGTKSYKVSKDCQCEGKMLKGRVKIVENGGDFRVRVCSGFADLKVKTVSYTPTQCGEWQIVDYSPDFTVKIVGTNDAFDFTIEFVSNSPGVD